MEHRSAVEVVSMVEQAGYTVEFMEAIASPAGAKPTQDLVLIAQRG
jgi:hypothetical protein